MPAGEVVVFGDLVETQVEIDRGHRKLGGVDGELRGTTVGLGDINRFMDTAPPLIDDSGLLPPRRTAVVTESLARRQAIHADRPDATES